MPNLKITEVPQASAVAATDDFYIKTGETFRRVPVSKLMELFITGGLSGWGFGYATCSTAEATAAKTAVLTGYQLIKGGFVAVRFTNAVRGGATLSINSQTAKAIYYNGSAIGNNVIRAGDIAVLCYDGTYYQLVSIMPAGAVILELEKSGSTVSLNMTFADAYAAFSNPWNTYLLLTVDTYVALLMRPSKVDAVNSQISIEATVGTTLYTATLIPVVGQPVLSGTLVETQIGGGSSDAVTYSAQTGRTDAEKAQARTNIGAGTYSKPAGGIPDGDLAIYETTITQSGSSWQSNHSFADIIDAYNYEKQLRFYNGNTQLTPIEFTGSYITLAGVYPSSGRALLRLFAITSSGVGVSEHPIGDAFKPTDVQVSGSTPTITAEDNHVYSCGEITSLTITDSAQNISFKVDFTSGSTATVINAPSGYKAPGGDLTAEANKEYELDVRNGKAVLTAFEAVSAS